MTGERSDAGKQGRLGLWHQRAYWAESSSGEPYGGIELAAVRSIYRAEESSWVASDAEKRQTFKCEFAIGSLHHTRDTSKWAQRPLSGDGGLLSDCD